MSSSIKQKLFIVGSVLLTAALVGYLDRRHKRLKKQNEKPSGVYRYTTGPYTFLYVYGLLFLLFHIVCLLTPSEFVPMLHWDLAFLFLLLPITILLLALMPWLRRHFSARTCAELWIVPGALFCGPLILQRRIMADPLLVIRLSSPVLWTAFVTWLIGFLSVLLWKMFFHLRFRKHILQDAVQAEQWEYGLYAQVWQAMVPPAEVTYRNSVERSVCRHVEAILDYRHILRSPAVSSPLTIGLRNKNIYLVLPAQAYSRDDLEMILRHEIIHLLRDDIRTKVFLALICAAGWFIPSLWFGIGKASEDLELCCDEVATADMEPEQRRAYANLLLSNAGTAKGFTTCLSASARGFRYRLKQVLLPRRRISTHNVNILIIALFFLLIGSVGIQERLGTVQTEILDKGWQVYAVYSRHVRTYSTSPVLVETTEKELQGLKLERALWKDNQDLFEYDIPYYEYWKVPSSEEVRVILARDNGEKMLLRVFADRIVVHAGDVELYGQRYTDDSKPTVYLIPDP